DVMIAGPLMADLLEAFEVYWRSPLSRPLPKRRGDQPDADTTAAARDLNAASVAASAELLAAFSRPPGGWQAWLDDFLDAVMPGKGEVLLDAPEVDEQRPEELYERFKALVRQAEGDLILSSPYLVPDRAFVSLLEDLV